MPAPAEAFAVQRVRCRQIVDSDLDTLAGMFMVGFPHHTREFWDSGLARLAALAPIDGMSRIGYTLESDKGLVGALLTISSRRGPQIISNVSAWYVERPYRAHSTLLVSMATKRKDVIYLNASPADHTVRTLEPLGWKPYSSGRSAVFPVLRLGGGSVGEDIPADLPEYTLLKDHRSLGCVSVVCEKNGNISPFVFKRRWITRHKLPVMELIYCRGTQEFERCSGALGRYFLKKRKSLGFIIDGKFRGAFSRYADGKELRLYKGPRAPERNDLAYTEKVIFP